MVLVSQHGFQFYFLKTDAIGVKYENQTTHNLFTLSHLAGVCIR